MKNSTLVIELVGPPGSGKTTLTQALCRRDGILNGGFPDIRDPNNLAFFIGNGLTVLPLFFSLYRGRQAKMPTRRDLAYMAIVTGWPRVLRDRSFNHGRVLLLDQGPVYMLTGLSQYHPTICKSAGARAWWDKTCAQWAGTLDLVVCLDAPDQTLIERIRNREKQHGIKTNSEQQAIQYLSDHRSAQSKVVSDLVSVSIDCRVLSLDTTQLPLDETASQILEALKKIKRKNVNIK